MVERVALHCSVVSICFLAYVRHRRWYLRLIECFSALSDAQLEDRLLLQIGLDRIGILLLFLIPSLALRMVS